jgi:hypothetical protein
VRAQTCLCACGERALTLLTQMSHASSVESCEQKEQDGSVMSAYFDARVSRVPYMGSRPCLKELGRDRANKTMQSSQLS